MFYFLSNNMLSRTKKFQAKHRQVFGKGRHVLKKDGGLLVYASLCVSKSFFMYFQFLDNVWRLLS